MWRRLVAGFGVLVAVGSAAVVGSGVASAETEIVCPMSVPPGWIHTNSFFVINVCGSGPTFPNVPTQWEITRYDNAFRDDVLDVCTDATTPPGWTAIGTEVWYGWCGLRFGPPNPPPNIRHIKCLNCPVRPMQPPQPTPVIGSVDAVFPTGVVAGWAKDPGAPGGSVVVHFYLDGEPGTGLFLGQATANQFRSDVGAHAYSFPLPPTVFNDAPHTVYAYGIDLNPNEHPQRLGFKQFRFPNRPIGNFDGIDGNGTAFGWSLDPSQESLSAANRVRFIIDTFVIGDTAADLPRPDVQQSAGYPGNHGFRWPIPQAFRDGHPHTLQAVGVDLTGQPDRELTGSPRTFQLNRPKTALDVDADHAADIGIWRPGSGAWWFQPSTGGNSSVTFGLPGDKPVPADYDGDGRTDVAVFRPSEGNWYVLAAGGTVTVTAFGLNGDVPVPGDYDGDGRADLAVFRPGDGTWYILPSTGGSYFGTPFGQPTDKVVPADYDGDGRMDIAVYRPLVHAWFVRGSATGQVTTRQFGATGDLLVPADYDGDTLADVAIFRPSTGAWWIHRSLDDRDMIVPWGVQGDVPAPADYDGDGHADPTVFRPATGTWLQLLSTTGGLASTTFGLAGDIPLASTFLS